MKKIILTILLFFVLSIFPIYQLIALNSLEIQNFTIKNFGMNSKLLFTVAGTGELYNPSAIPVTIKEINYVGIIKNEGVFGGTIKGMRIPAGAGVEFPFTEEIDWVPDQETVQEILQGKNVTVVIHTEADVSYLYFFTLTGKKEIEIPLTKLLKPYVEEQVVALSELLLTNLF